jgi:hypothetical protein
MHPTADTLLVICNNGAGRRVIGGVMRLASVVTNAYAKY